MVRRHRLNDQLHRYEEKLSEQLSILSVGKLWFACAFKNLFFFFFFNERIYTMVNFLSVNQNFQNSYLGLIRSKRE